MRVIAATNRDLKARIVSDEFREDLYYRINTVVLTVPPLRERREDIPILIEHFMQRFNHLMGKSLRVVTEDAMRALLTYDWPGNIRELEHAVEHAFVLQKGTAITLHDLPGELIEVQERRGRSIWKTGHGTLAEVQQRTLESALQRNHWNKSDTCQDLGISRTTLWRRMRALGLLER